MEESRAPVGLLISSVAAAVLAISVFLPWYGVSITSSGAVAAQQEIAAVVAQYGNSALQTKVKGMAPELSSLAGRQLATVSAHQVLKRVSLILLGLAAIALLASLLRIADMRGLFWATGGQIALLGTLAAGVVVFRMVVRPGAAVSFMRLSPTWGAWLAFVSALAIVFGGLVAGSAGTGVRARSKVGPGPPPLGRVPSL
jgi:hypothetical protein